MVGRLTSAHDSLSVASLEATIIIIIKELTSVSVYARRDAAAAAAAAQTRDPPSIHTTLHANRKASLQTDGRTDGWIDKRQQPANEITTVVVECVLFSGRSRRCKEQANQLD